MLGRPRESARLAEAALPVFRGYGLDHSTLVANRIEALVASGEWDEAERASAAALRAITANFPHHALITRGELEVGRGDFDAARAHFDDGARHPALWTATWRSTTRSSSSSPCGSAAGRMPTRPCATVWRGRAPATWPRSASGCAPRDCAQQAELAALARARQRRRRRPRPPQSRADAARRGARRRSGGLTGHAERRRLASARRGRVRARPRRRAARAVVRRPRTRGSGSSARRSRPTAAGARPRRSSPPARRAPTRPRRSRRRMPSPLGSERGRCCASSSCSPSARGSIRRRWTQARPDARQSLQELLGLTPREAEVLTLVARGLTNREIAADARHQRQDRRRARLAHPAQARRTEPARGGRDRAPDRLGLRRGPGRAPWSMPPMPAWFRGHGAIAAFLARATQCGGPRRRRRRARRSPR